MSELNRYSTSAGGALQNASGYFPEGQAPSTVNDAARTLMADLRRQHQVWSAEKTATYSAGAYAITYDREITAGELKGVYTFIAAEANSQGSGSSTLNINSLGAKDIVTPSGHLNLSDINAQQICTVAYNPSANNYTLLTPTRNTPAAAPNESTLGTEQASTSGTEFDFNIPAWAKRVTIQLVGVSVSGTSSIMVQIGDAGGFKTSGYLGASSLQLHTAVNTVQAYTAGFGIFTSAATNVIRGALVLTLENSAAFTWVASGDFARSDVAGVISSAGSASLSAALTQVRVTTVNGTDTFDAGEINVLYE